MSEERKTQAQRDRERELALGVQLVSGCHGTSLVRADVEVLPCVEVDPRTGTRRQMVSEAIVTLRAVIRWGEPAEPLGPKPGFEHVPDLDVDALLAPDLGGEG